MSVEINIDDSISEIQIDKNQMFFIAVPIHDANQQKGTMVLKTTTVYWMVRLTRSGVSQTAFCPAKYFHPANNPNSSSYPYGYWTNTMS